MFSGKLGRRTLTSFIAGAILALAVPALAQTGRIQGKVVDDKDAAVPGAQVVVTAIPDQGGQKWQATSDKNGNYIIGTLPKSGQYLVVANKEGVGTDEARVGVKIGNFTTTNFKLSRAARVSEEQAKKNAEIKKFFEAGVVAAQAGNHQAAVEAFTNAGAAMPTCADCYFNVGVSQQMLKDSAAAEAAFKKAIELRPNYPEAYNALAALYTADKKMDLGGRGIVEGGRAAASRPRAAAMPIRSIALAWGSGTPTSSPRPERRSKRRSRPTPNHADSHFMLGKVYLNLGKLKEAAGEFDAYLKLQPTGKNSAEAKTTYEALKPMLK